MDCAPHVIGNAGGMSFAVAGAGNLCFLGLGGSVVILDTSDPSAPRELSRFAVGGWVRDIRVSGTHLYISAETGGMVILDIADPAAPRVASVFSLGHPVHESDINGTLLALAAEDLVLLDVSNPREPSLLGASGVINEGARGVDLEGSRAFVAGNSGDLLVFDVAAPSFPALITEFGMFESSTQVASRGVFTYFFSRELGFAMFREVAPNDFRYSAGLFLDGASDVQIERTLLHSTWGRYADTLDITNPLAITRRDPTYSLRSQGEGIAGVPGRLYVAERDHGLSIFDNSTPGEPRRVGEFGGTSRPTAVAHADGLAFTADYDQGISVVDVRDPHRAAVLSRLVTRGRSWEVRIVGDLLYVADDQSGFTIVDVSDPASPRLRGSYDLPGQTLNVEEFGNFAYAVNGNIYTLDTTNPDAIVQTSVLDTSARDLCRAGDTLFAVDTETLTVIDLTDRAHPAIITRRRVFSDADRIVSDVAARDGRVYISAWDVGLVIMDVSDRRVPTVVGQTDRPGQYMAVTVRGDRAYLAKDLEGVEVFDISDPTQPQFLGLLSVGGQAWDILATPDVLLVAALQAGVVTATLGGPSILSEPRDATTCLGGAVALSVQLEDPRDAAYQWLHEGAPIEGATNPEYTFLADSPADAGSYSVLITTPCGSLESQKALVTICLADFTCDGQVDFFDYLEFAEAFAAEDPAADRDGNSQVDFFDYLDFVMAFSGDC
jgi:hypothetical protein